MTRYRRYAFPGARRWQDLREMRSRATGSGKILPRCVLGRSAIAKCPRNAFPSVRRWQDCALMHSWPDLTVAIFSRGALPGVLPWQDSAAVRSRASLRGKFCAPCIPKVASDGKTPVRDKIRAPCIRNELALAGYARQASEKPRKPPLENTPREYLARKGRFSLHKPLESCTARRSCHRSAHERKGSGRKCLRFVKN